MEYVDLDQIVEVPDTPDRVAVKIQDVGQDIGSSIAFNLSSCDVGDDDFQNNLAGIDWRRTEDGRKGLSYLHGRGICDPHVYQKQNGSDVSGKISSFHTASDKAVQLTFSSESFQENDACQSKVESGRRSELVANPTSHKFLNNRKVLEFRKGPMLINGGSSQIIGDSLKSAKVADKGKAKVTQPICKIRDSDVDHGTQGNLSKLETEKNASMTFQPINSSNLTGRKRLVRNGCISPHNIAKVKQISETRSNSANIEEPKASNEVSVGPRNVIDVDDVIVKESASDQIRGKWVTIHPHSSRNLSVRVNGAGQLAEKYPSTGIPHNDSCIGQNKRINLVASTSSIQPEFSSLDGQCKEKLISTARQIKNARAPDNCVKDREVVYVGSCGESSLSRGISNDSSYQWSGTQPHVETDEASPKVGYNQNLTDNHLEARTRQIEADEMLARELQEQLYQEIPATRSNSASHGEGQSQFSPFENLPPRRRSQRRVPASRFTRLRNRIHHRASASSSGGRQTLFPSEMDVDMRIEILEALEAVVNDDIRMASQLLNYDREFDANDYEMLLALDENNHTNLGASHNQIANLPQSTVQTDNYETCSICLEMPAVGDTMRHLPCLHKFHRDVSMMHNSDRQVILRLMRAHQGASIILGMDLFMVFKKATSYYVVLSTTEEKYVAAASAACQAVWLYRMVKELKHEQKVPATIMCDNVSAITLAKKAFHNR